MVDPSRDVLHINRPRWYTLDILSCDCDRDRIDVVVDNRPQGKQFLLRISQLSWGPITNHAHERWTKITGSRWGIDQIFVTMIRLKADHFSGIQRGGLFAISRTMNVDSVVTIRAFLVAVMYWHNVGTVLVTQTQVQDLTLVKDSGELGMVSDNVFSHNDLLPRKQGLLHINRHLGNRVVLCQVVNQRRFNAKMLVNQLAQLFHRLIGPGGLGGVDGFNDRYNVL